MLQQQPQQSEQVVAAVTHPVLEDADGPLALILLHMPLHKLFELRSVCKLWRSLLTSPSFLQEWEQMHRRWVVMRKMMAAAAEEELLAYDDFARSWFDLGKLLAHRLHSIDPLHLPQTAHGILVNIVCFSVHSVGLVCIVDQHSAQFLVLNPVTGAHSFVRLPESYSHLLTKYSLAKIRGSSQPQYLIAFLPDDSRNDDICHPRTGRRQRPWPQHFRIIFVDYTRDDGYFRLYNSRRSTLGWQPEKPWLVSQTCPPPPPPLHIVQMQTQDLVVVDRNMLVVVGLLSDDEKFGTLDASTAAPYVQDLLKYDEEIFSRLRSSIIFRHRGRQYLALPKPSVALRGGGLRAGGDDVFAGFTVLEMHIKPRLCSTPKGAIARVDLEEIASTPAHLCQGFYPSLSGAPPMNARFAYAGGLVCMTAGYKNELPASHGHGRSRDDILLNTMVNAPLVYDMDACSWYHLPEPPNYPPVYASYPRLSVVWSIRPSFLAVLPEEDEC